MSVVDLEILQGSGLVRYRNVYVLELTFTHDDGAITETETLVFPAEFKADAIACVNTLREANEFIQANCTEPEDGEVEGYDEYCGGVNTISLDSWPTDHNGNYYASLDFITVSYYNADGTEFGVKQVEG